MAFDADTGEVRWLGEPVEFSSGQQSSAIVANGLRVMFTTGPDFDPEATQGYALYDAATGVKRKEALTIPANTEPGQVSSGVWGTPTYDDVSKMLYVGTSNPESKTTESPYDDAIIKLDLDESRETFGTIVGSYKGTPDSATNYENPGCQEVGGDARVNGGVYGSSPACGQLDVDFGVGPTLWRSNGTLYGAATQKSGFLHIFNAENMTKADTKQLWVSMSFVGGNLARIATDGNVLYVAANPCVPYAFDAHDFHEIWRQPLTGLPMKGGNVALANGVVYYVDEPGVKAFQADDGTPIAIPGATQLGSTSGSGIAIAGHYVVANHYGVIAAYKLPDS